MEKYSYGMARFPISSDEEEGCSKRTRTNTFLSTDVNAGDRRANRAREEREDAN